MTRRIFAVLRAAIIAPLFISLWTYFIPRWFGGRHAFDDPRAAGWIVVAIGAAIALPCIWQFAWRGLGTPAPFDPPRRLVVSGPYRYVRNPMYVGMVIVIAGLAIVFPNITRGMLIEAAAFWALAALFVLAFEEPVLRSMFGKDYEDYRAHVRRWIPRVGPWYARPHLE
ncbi:MAG: isoprenylcysteine carboxylmethyltransferase family protein [Acidobacteriota bacterium]